MSDKQLSRDWVLSQLAGMKFTSATGYSAYDYMKRAIEASDTAAVAKAAAEEKKLKHVRKSLVSVVIAGVNLRIALEEHSPSLVNFADTLIREVRRFGKQYFGMTPEMFDEDVL